MSMGGGVFLRYFWIPVPKLRFSHTYVGQTVKTHKGDIGPDGIPLQGREHDTSISEKELSDVY